jgi:hypothetical protein
VKCGGCDLIWVLTQLAIEVWMIVRIHAAFENLSIRGSVKKPCGEPQRGYAITASPSFTYVAALRHRYCPHQSCVVIDLYGTSFRSSSLLSLILSFSEAESCGPPAERCYKHSPVAGIHRHWQLSAFVVSRHTFLDQAVGGVRV